MDIHLTDTKTSVNTSSSSHSLVKTKAASAPVVLRNDGSLKQQISAPSYLCSLKDNPAAPFVRPERETRPKLVTDTIMMEEDAITMVACAESDPVLGLKKFLGEFLVKKEIVPNYHISEKRFLILLLEETVDYAAQRDFSAHKLACLITIYLHTHLYFKWYYWSGPAPVWSYFKELMIRHTIEDSPDGEEVFDPEECYDIVTHFHMAYLTNLPLVHALCFGVWRLKFNWPFKPDRPDKK